jgi:hypothetical protein
LPQTLFLERMGTMKKPTRTSPKLERAVRMSSPFQAWHRDVKKARVFSGSPAFTFVLAMGVVNLFADVTYEGGTAINGPFLSRERPGRDECFDSRKLSQ